MPIPDKHTVAVDGTAFVVDTKYRPHKILGQGAYGVVCAASVEGEEDVAIKKITGVFNKEVNIAEARRTLREIKLLRALDHENITRITHIMLPYPHVRDFEDVYLVSDRMDSDLHKIIQSSNVLTEDHVKFFLYQILRALKYIHSANIIHRDLKPGNLLLNANCDLKITDFGLARAIEADEDIQMTQYVVTRWYRAPEILLMVDQYTKAVDVWSVGCIFAEMLGRKALFPGTSYLHQLSVIIQQLGTPSKGDMENIPKKLANLIQSLPNANKRSFKDLFPDTADDGLDLLSQMLQFSAEKRITVEGALRHPYLSELHDEPNEPEAAEPVYMVEIENESLTLEDLRDLMLEEALLYHPDVTKQELLEQHKTAGGKKRGREEDVASTSGSCFRKE